jgi:hypothetical protein
VKPKQETEKVMAESMVVQDEEKQVEFLEHEIECPCCHDSMTLCFDFDSLYYLCGECDFCLYTIKE